MVLTDPPYLARFRDRSVGKVPNEDNDRWLVPAFAELYRVLANRSFCISFYG
jgi:adenine-specific DNA-methyltransferase